MVAQGPMCWLSRGCHVLRCARGGASHGWLRAGGTGRPCRCLTCDSKDWQVSTPARSHCRLRRFSIMMCPKRSPMFTCRDKRPGVSMWASSRYIQDTTPHSNQGQPHCHPGQAAGRRPLSTQPVAHNPLPPTPPTGVPAHTCKGKAVHCSSQHNRRTWNKLKHPSFGVK